MVNRLGRKIIKIIILLFLTKTFSLFSAEQVHQEIVVKQIRALDGFGRLLLYNKAHKIKPESKGIPAHQYLARKALLETVGLIKQGYKISPNVRKIAQKYIIKLWWEDFVRINIMKAYPYDQ
ncbi:MAG: hypothetical protein ACJAZS_000814 [Alteromonas naphthalenivorans]|jgi:hypothetical protein